MLDTGLDLLHPDIRACENQVKGIHNWIDSGDPQQIIDSNGHGTCVAGLLLDFAPGADLFVAKIAEKKPLDPRMIAAVSIKLERSNSGVSSCTDKQADAILLGHRLCRQGMEGRYDFDVLRFSDP